MMHKVTLSLCCLAIFIVAAYGEAIATSPNGVNVPISTKKTQKLDGHFFSQGGETYGNHQGRFFKPSLSSTFDLIKLDNVNVTFLDNTNLRGYDAADMATLGKYTVDTRMGMIEHCNSRNFDDVDGILGFGWADQPRSAALLKTLTQADRPGWNIHGQPFAGDGSPMPRKFAFTANNQIGELQLGGYDQQMVAEEPVMFPMTGENVYGIDIHSITYGGVELLHFEPSKVKKSFVGEFDSGTTCLLLPNTDVKGNFSTSPFGILAREQMAGKRHSLMYHTKDVYGQVHTYEMDFNECVEPTDETMILGDPFFRQFVVIHDLENLNDKKMGLAPRNPGYQLGTTTDRSILTPGHAPRQQMFSAHPVSKIHAKRKMRDHKFVQALHQTKKSMAKASELHEHPTMLSSMLVDKVAVKSQSMVTYNIQLAIGSPPQPLDVIFDTGSFMLAVFAEPPPEGMKPLLKADDKKSGEAKKKGEAKKTDGTSKGEAKKTDETSKGEAKKKGEAKHKKDSGEARVLLPDAGEFGTNRAFLGMSDTVDGKGMRKARPQQLVMKNTLKCGRGGPCPKVPLFEEKNHLTSPAEVAWAKGFEVEAAADKAPTTMLAAPQRFQPGYHVPQKLPEAGGMGTNKAFLGKYDGRGQSTKAPVPQALHMLQRSASKQVAKDVSAYLFKKASTAGF